MKGGSRRRAAFGLLLAVAAGCCGKKGPPLPPIPEAPTAGGPVRVRQSGYVAELLVPLPARMADGRPITALSGLRVYRIERPLPSEGAAPPPLSLREFRESVPAALTVEGEDAARLHPGGEHRATLPLGEPQKVAVTPPSVVYWSARVRAAGHKWSTPSSPSLLIPGPPPPAPTGLSAAPTAAGPRLSWNPAAAQETAIFRAAAGGPFPFEPVVRLPADASSWVDSAAGMGSTWTYEIRSVVGTGIRARFSEAAGPVAVGMRDLFPPAPPSGLAALPRAGGVDLFWSPNEDADVAGYRVYRRDMPDGEWVRVGPGRIEATTWSDGEVSPGSTYSYAVTAVDSADPANESGRSEERTVTVPIP